jgi:hypothetical protein
MNAHAIVQLAHVLILGPLLVAIGLGKGPSPNLVAALGIFIVLYHAYKTYAKLTAGSGLGAAWVNLIHVLVVGPVLIAEGLNPSRWSREVILMFAAAAIGYHGYYLVKGIGGDE